MAENNRTKNSLLLEILSPEGEIFKEEVSEVILPTSQGEIAVLPNHAALFTKLTSGEIIARKSGRDSYIAITGGFLEINNNYINVLADYAIRSEKIEAKRAEEAKKRAEETLKKKEKLSDFDFEHTEKELQKSILELKVSEKVRKRHRPS